MKREPYKKAVKVKPETDLETCVKAVHSLNAVIKHLRMKLKYLAISKGIEPEESI